MSITPVNRLEKTLKGAFLELDTLIGARFEAKDLKLLQRRSSLSQLAGPNKTNFRGRGLDFAEVRAYQAGDDIRSIDWRVTARSGKPYTKLFQEERERPVLVVTDQRQSMFFGSQHCFKSVMAGYLSALIAWAGLQQGDRVGGLVFGNEQQQEIRPRRSRQSVLALMHLLLDYNQQLNRNNIPQRTAEQSLVETLTDLRRIAKPGCAIYLISDFSGFNDETVQKHLYQLSKHCEITALFIYDQLEQELPPPGRYTVSDGEHRNTIQTNNRQLRQRYSEHVKEAQRHLQQQLNQLGIPLITVGTEQAPLKRLLNFYGRAR